MNSIRKALFVIICLCFLLLPKTVISEEDADFIIQISISGGNGEYVVNIQDDKYYAEKKPTVFVNTDIEGDLARVVDENNREISNKLVDGEVSFKISNGGTYYITKGTKEYKPEDFAPRNTTPEYSIPKTGIE